MRINFSQQELFQMVQAWLASRGMQVPDDAAGLFEVEQDSEGQLLVGVDAEFVQLPTPPAQPQVRNGARPVVQARAPRTVDPDVDPRTVPGPPPEPEEEVSPADMANLRVQSEGLSRAGPAKGSYVPARARHARTQIAASIEAMGKDPTDISDEL